LAVKVLSAHKDVYLRIFLPELVAVMLLHMIYGYKLAKYTVALSSPIFAVIQFFKVELVFTDLRGVFLLSNVNEFGTCHSIKIKHLQKIKSTNLALLSQRIWHFLGCESTNLTPINS